MRKIEVNGETYEWEVGQSHVKIKLPNGKKVFPYIWEVGYKLDPDIAWSVAPRNVANWIKLVLLKTV